MYPEASEIKSLVESAKRILIIQPDNPDGDSLGSSLGLEQIFAELGKETELICGTYIGSYLCYFQGWDRVESDLSRAKFDLAVLVDTSSLTLIENLTKQNKAGLLRSKPLIVLDHHQTESSIDFAKVLLRVPQAAATAEVIYELANQLSWDIPLSGKKTLASAILSDTLGLTSASTTARTIHIIGELVEAGVSISALESARRDTMRKSPGLVNYKGQLLQRIEYHLEDKLALLTIPWGEIEKYSPEYNPAVLALEDMRLTTNTVVAIVLKRYKDGKLTAKIRTNHGSPIANKLAEHFGGGGHEYASGFKLTNNPDLDELKQQIINYTQGLLG